jgi:hypothetical protein
MYALYCRRVHANNAAANSQLYDVRNGSDARTHARGEKVVFDLHIISPHQRQRLVQRSWASYGMRSAHGAHVCAYSVQVGNMRLQHSHLSPPSGL